MMSFTPSGHVGNCLFVQFQLPFVHHIPDRTGVISGDMGTGGSLFWGKGCDGQGFVECMITIYWIM